MDLTAEPETLSSSLESKIHSFLQGNPGFSTFDLGLNSNPMGGDVVSPVTGTDNQDGTPVRDEGGGTPTQDEIMDKPAPFTSSTDLLSVGQAAPTSYQNSTQTLGGSQQPAHLPPAVPQNGQIYPPQLNRGIPAPIGHYQQMPAQTAVPGERPPGRADGTLTLEDFQGAKERGRWYGDSYPEGGSQLPRGYGGENATSGLNLFQTEQRREHPPLTPPPHQQQPGGATPSGFFRSNLPPIPNPLPPPSHGAAFSASRPAAGVTLPPLDQQQVNQVGEGPGGRVGGALSGMVVHDHQHKTMFHPDDPLYKMDRPHLRPPEGLRPHPDDLRYHDELRRRDGLLFQDDAYRHPDGPYHRAGSPPHPYLRHRGATPPLSPSEDPYYARDYQHRSPGPPPPHYAPRRPPPPHPEMRLPGPRPPHHPAHPVRHLPLRGPPHAPFPPFQGPNPRLRGKRPGPRGGGHPGPMFVPKRPFLPPRY